MGEVHPVVVPQLNVNDETVQLVEWLVAHGDTVAVGQPLCEVETSKSTAELEAECEGVVFQEAESGSVVAVGARIALIGPDLEACEAQAEALARALAQSREAQAGGRPLRATPSARALADEHSVVLEDVAALGVRGTIKESDVRRYIEKNPAPATPADTTACLPAAMARYVEEQSELSRHEMAVVESLRYSLDNLLLAHLDSELELGVVNQGIAMAREQKTMLSLLHVAISALGRTLPDFPALMSFRADRRLYRYRRCDVAFVVRTGDGRLFTPVIREVDKLDVKGVARSCLEGTMNVNRGQIGPEELEGACFTVSHIATHGARRFVALPNKFQSAILAVAGERSVAKVCDGKAESVPVVTLTLSYDHALCDGMYAAEFLDRLKKEMEACFS